MYPIETRLKNFTDAVSFAADEDLQRTMWITRSPKPLTSIYSISEFYGQIFDDSDIDDFIEKELPAASLTADQKRGILGFRDLLNLVEKTAAYRSQDHARLCESPEWKAVVQCAKRILPRYDEFSFADQDAAG